MMRSLATALALLMLVGAGPAGADEAFPTRPITIINPFPPGGLADLTGRPLAAALERVLRQPVVLINADPCIIVVNAELPWRSMKELKEDAGRRPGEIIFSSSGIYGASHVPMEMLLQAAGGLKMRHLPTTGGGPATTAVLGGHAHLWCSTTGPASPHIKSGKFRALAVTSAARHPHFPDVPTLQELGYPVEYYLWIGLFAPRNTPISVMKVLREAVRQAVEDPNFRNAMEKIQTPTAYKDADDFRTWWDAEAVRLAEVIGRIGKVEGK